MQCNPVSWATAAYRSLPLINVSDTWLCFFLSIILTVKQNDCVKDTKIFVRCLFQAIRLWLVKIKIVTVGYPPPQKSAGDKTAPPQQKKNPAKAVDVEKKSLQAKKVPPQTPSITSVAVEDGIQTFRFRTIWVRSIYSVFSLTN